MPSAPVNPPAAYGGYGGYSQPAPVVIHNTPSNDNSFLWYMLGRSTADHHDHYIERDHYNHESPGYQGNAAAPAAANGVLPGQPVPAQVGSAQNSGGSWAMAILRFVLWVMILSAIGWAIWYFFFRNKAASKPESHYSLK